MVDSTMWMSRWFFFFSSRRRHTRWPRDWSSDVCSSDLRGESECGPGKNRAGARLDDLLSRFSAASLTVVPSRFEPRGTRQLFYSFFSTARSEERRVGKEW